MAEKRRQLVGAPLVGALRRLLWRPNLDAIALGTGQGNCIKLGQNHVRLPESGRGAPCGRPSQGITLGTVQIVVRYRKFSTSLATGGRFLGRKKKTIGRGAHKGRPSSAILASELRCVCPGGECDPEETLIAVPSRLATCINRIATTPLPTQLPNQPRIHLHRLPQLLDLDPLSDRVGLVNIAGAEHQRVHILLIARRFSAVRDRDRPPRAGRAGSRRDAAYGYMQDSNGDRVVRER